MSNGFGTGSLERQFDGPKYFKLKDPDVKKGDDFFELPPMCILAPMKSLATNPDGWKVFIGSHFGHYGVNSRDPGKGRPRPFRCIERKNRDKEIVTACPKCNQVAARKNEKTAREEAIKAQHPGLDEDGLRDIFRNDVKLGEINSWLKKHNNDKKFWMNVMTINGEFGILQLSYTTLNQVLLPFLRQLRDSEGINALNMTNGVWLTFRRTGRRPRVTDTVSLVREKTEINGKWYDSIKPSSLTEAQMARALEVCPDLSTVIKTITAEQMTQLLGCNDDPAVVDEIIDGPKVKTSQASTDAYDDSEDDDGQAASTPTPTFKPGPQDLQTTPAVTRPAPTPAATAVVTTAPTGLDPEEEELERKLAAKRAARQATQTPPTQSGIAGADEWLAQYRAK